MFRRALCLGLTIVVVAGVSALLDPADAGPLNGKGKGVCKPNPAHCKFCPPPEPGCMIFECSKCGCDYICGEATVSLPAIR